MDIPGLLRVPIEDSTSDDIKLASFNLKMYSVPGAHRSGKCRPLSDYERLSRIGEGSYGIVFKAKDKASNKIVAIKKLKIDKELQLMPQNFLREITNLKLLKHENIVNLIEVAVGESFESTFLILEYCKYSLSEVIDDDPNSLQHPQIKNIMCQLLTGLDFIHKHKIFHRDLNPANILFTEMGILKITDFGSSRKTTKADITPNVGTREYRAPEILFGSINYTLSVDIWSIGCIFAEMLLKKNLFRGHSDCDIIVRIIDFLGTPTEKTWPGLSKLPLLRDFRIPLQKFNKMRSTFIGESVVVFSMLQKTLCYNPLNRFSAEECLRNPYFPYPPEICSYENLVSVLKASKAI